MAKRSASIQVAVVLLVFVLTLVLLLSFSEHTHTESPRSPRESGPGPPTNNTSNTTLNENATTAIPPTTQGTNNVSLPQDTNTVKTTASSAVTTPTIVPTTKSVVVTTTTPTIVQTTNGVVQTTTPEHVTQKEIDNTTLASSMITAAHVDAGTTNAVTTSPMTSMQPTAICQTEPAKCDGLTEVCVDLADRYRCDCRPSFYRHVENGACQRASIWDGSLRIVRIAGQPAVFDQTLADPNSPGYQQLAADVSRSLDLVFKENNATNATYSGNNVTGFYQGSIISTYKVFFTQDSPIGRNDLQTAAAASLTNGGALPGGSLEVDPSRIAFIWTNECLQNTDDCSPDAACRNLGSKGFTCICNQGLFDVSPPSLPGRICSTSRPTTAAPTEGLTSGMPNGEQTGQGAPSDEWALWVKIVIPVSVTFGIFVVTIIVSLIQYCRNKRNERLRELTKNYDEKDEDGRPRFVDYSYMYEQPISEPRSNEEVGYDGDASVSASECDMHSLAMGSFPPTPVPTPRMSRRATRDASVEVNLKNGEDAGPSSSDPAITLAKLTGILALMQNKGKGVFDRTSRQTSEDTVDSNLGDETGPGGGGQPAGGQATGSKMTFLNIPTERNPQGADNRGFESAPDPNTPKENNGDGNGNQQDEETSCLIM